MSRLYLRAAARLRQRNGDPGRACAACCRRLIDTQGGLSTRARLALRYEHLLLRPALASDTCRLEALSGRDRRRADRRAICTWSALLGRILEHLSGFRGVVAAAQCRAFRRGFRRCAAAVDGVVHEWLASERGLAATPHAQRSRADVRVELRPAFDELPLAALIDAVEQALGHAGADRGQARGRTGVRPAQCREPDVLRRRRAPRGGGAVDGSRASSASTRKWRTSRACTRTMRWRGSAAQMPRLQ